MLILDLKVLRYESGGRLDNLYNLVLEDAEFASHHIYLEEHLISHGMHITMVDLDASIEKASRERDLVAGRVSGSLLSLVLFDAAVKLRDRAEVTFFTFSKRVISNIHSFVFCFLLGVIVTIETNALSI